MRALSPLTFAASSRWPLPIFGFVVPFKHAVDDEDDEDDEDDDDEDDEDDGGQLPSRNVRCWRPLGPREAKGGGRGMEVLEDVNVDEAIDDEGRGREATDSETFFVVVDFKQAPPTLRGDGCSLLPSYTDLLLTSP